MRCALAEDGDVLLRVDRGSRCQVAYVSELERQASRIQGGWGVGGWGDWTGARLDHDWRPS